MVSQLSDDEKVDDYDAPVAPVPLSVNKKRAPSMGVMALHNRSSHALTTAATPEDTVHAFQKVKPGVHPLPQ